MFLALALSGCHWGLYSATAEIQLRPRGVTAIGPPGAVPYEEDVRLVVPIVQSNRFLSPIIERLKLARIWAQRQRKDEDTLAPNEALQHLRQMLKVEPIRGTNIVNITASSEVPQESADIANAIADQYKAMRDYEEDQVMQRG